MKVSQNIKMMRILKDFSQKQLAEMLGMTQQQLSQYENDDRVPRKETLEKIADALECPVELLMAKENEIDEEGREIYDPSDLINFVREQGIKPKMFNALMDLGDSEKVKTGEAGIRVTKKYTHFHKTIPEIDPRTRLLECYDAVDFSGKGLIAEYAAIIASHPDFQKPKKSTDQQ